jgi:hypothetical protein
LQLFFVVAVLIWQGTDVNLRDVPQTDIQFHSTWMNHQAAQAMLELFQMLKGNDPVEVPQTLDPQTLEGRVFREVSSNFESQESSKNPMQNHFIFCRA